MQHQRMQQEHIARLPGRLDELRVGARHAVGPAQAPPGLEVAVSAGDHLGADALRVRVEVLGDGRDALGQDRGAAALRGDVGEQGDHEEALLG